MAKPTQLRFLVCLFALTVMLAGCGDDADGENASAAPNPLSAKQTKRLLLQLPYRYEFRSVPIPQGADGAVAGRAIGRHQTFLNFGISLGYGQRGIPVAGSGISESYGYPKGGFIFTDDVQIKGPDGRLIANPKLRTAAQWVEANRMSVAMTDKLCLAATGNHCPL